MSVFAQDLAKLSVHPIKKERVNDLQYYFIDKGEGEAVFLLHGFPDMANTWDETVTALSKNYRVIAPFLRGYYPTDMASNGDYSTKSIASDIVALAEKLGIDTYKIVGQDWGASISYAVANLAPEKVTKIATLAIPHTSCLALSPALLYAGRHFIVFDKPSRAIKRSKKNNFEYIDVLYRRWSPDFKNYKESSDAIKETFKEEGRLEATLGYYWSLSKERKSKDEELTAFYGAIPKVPVLYLGGENDKGVTKKMVKQMRAKMPEGSKVIVYENAGHFLHREVFDVFIKDLSAFLENH